VATPRSQRPLDLTPVHTHELPLTPPADRNIPAEAWVEAPAELLSLGDEIGEATVLYLRQIGPFLVWRAGPGSARTDTAWMAVDVGDGERRFTFRQHADGRGEGTGPSGAVHERFRSWKEDLHSSK
jgi:hypothetical protein